MVKFWKNKWFWIILIIILIIGVLIYFNFFAEEVIDLGGIAPPELPSPA